MKTFLWFLIGVMGGFIAAHFVSKDPRGHDLLADVDARIAGFTAAFNDAYRAQEARLDSTTGN
ncbi:hypothetical protein [Microbacterium sp.]|uniref:hypothetical protein n=1 Tax=Microbacterium sp. TaxID=51671 RepID=UPI002632D8EB|nr:hypothetical protein [Microbacterium sp.]